MMFKMFQAHISNQIKDDFNETASNILSEFNISHSVKDIKDMKKGVFKSIVIFFLHKSILWKFSEQTISRKKREIYKIF